MVMPRHRPLQFRFLRKGANDPSRDDTLKISKHGENSVRLVYTEKNGDDPYTDILHLNYTQVMSYIHKVITLLALDEDPFQSMQFFIPGYPSLLLGVNTLHQHTNYILDMISQTLWNWPTVGREEECSTSSHTITQTDSLASIGSPEQPPNTPDHADRTESS